MFGVINKLVLKNLVWKLCERESGIKTILAVREGPYMGVWSRPEQEFEQPWLLITNLDCSPAELRPVFQKKNLSNICKYVLDLVFRRLGQYRHAIFRVICSFINAYIQYKTIILTKYYIDRSQTVEGVKNEILFQCGFLNKI